jgi:MerR family regulatory protein
MVQNSSSKALRSGNLAKATGVSPDTIRHYERIGILPRATRTESGYRLFPASAVERELVVPANKTPLHHDRFGPGIS